MYVVWAIVLFDLHYTLGTLIASPFLRLLSGIIAVLLVVLALDLPRFVGQVPNWHWFPALLILALVGVFSLPFAPNRLLARGGVQILLIFYVFAITTTLYIRTPLQCLPILTMFAWRFAWWTGWAGPKGLIDWHPTVSNYDGYGGLAVLGVGVTYYFALASRNRAERWALFGVTALCVLGVVASSARGAFLALLCVGAVIWWRSPRKGVTTLAFLGGVIVVWLSASLLFEPGYFYNEIMSAFTEGTEAGTGSERWNMWKAAMIVWTEHPIVGVGANNVGVFASTYFDYGEIEGFENPAYFWGKNMHNAYVQIISEFGLIGIGAFTWIMVDFVRKNRALLSPQALEEWTRSGAIRRFDLHFLARGIEAGMVGVALGNVVYASFFETWFVTLWAVNRMLWAATCARTPLQQRAHNPATGRLAHHRLRGRRGADL